MSVSAKRWKYNYDTPPTAQVCGISLKLSLPVPSPKDCNLIQSILSSQESLALLPSNLLFLYHQNPIQPDFDVHNLTCCVIKNANHVRIELIFFHSNNLSNEG